MSRLADIVAAVTDQPQLVKAVYEFGSYIYGTNTDESDHDFIVVVDDQLPVPQTLCFDASHYAAETREAQIDIPNVGDLNIMPEAEFLLRLSKQSIRELECLCAPPEFILLDGGYTTTLDLPELRGSVAALAGLAWVKAQKKLTVEKDYNLRIAKKSLFHSLRVLRFGVQIAKHGRVVDWKECNDLFVAIMANPATTWEPYKTEYKKLYNQYRTAFRLAAPM